MHWTGLDVVSGPGQPTHVPPAYRLDHPQTWHFSSVRGNKEHCYDGAHRAAETASRWLWIKRADMWLSAAMAQAKTWSTSAGSTDVQKPWNTQWPQVTSEDVSLQQLYIVQCQLKKIHAMHPLRASEGLFWKFLSPCAFFRELLQTFNSVRLYSKRQNNSCYILEVFQGIPNGLKQEKKSQQHSNQPVSQI